MDTQETKKCKYCQSDIPIKAKICPNCKKKQSHKGIAIFFLIFGIFIFLCGFGGLLFGDSDSTNSTQTSGTTKTTESVSYIKTTVTEMMGLLNSNALKAADTYKGKYVEVTGKLNVIDSSGQYISIYADGDFEIIGVTCYIKNNDQKQKVMDMSIGDTVTLKGKITDVGEVFGYSLNIDEIVD
ncbi:MAG: hypothetical protein J6S85_10330 [Methanobrevibacter sp.]|nr:hypothetical protein [Methanobrevibacter sp.]